MVNDGGDGISMLRSRIERRKRVVPIPPQPESPAEPSQAAKAGAADSQAQVSVQSPDAPHAAYPAAPALVLPQSDEPLSEGGAGVRLDDRVADLISELRRRHGIRIRKAELLEVLISELPLSQTADFVARVKTLRQQASTLR